MAKTADKRMIFLDTQVFEQLRHNYSHHKLKVMAELAAEGHIVIILTTVTVGEIESHIDEKVRAACSHLKKCIDEHTILQCVKTSLLANSPKQLSAAIRGELHQNFQEFCKAANVRVVSSEGVNMESILKSYFQYEQPFGEARNKEGFPDAIAGATLEQWAEREKQQVEVVTANRKHWQPICERSEWLRYAGDLANVLESLQDKTTVIRLRESVSKQLSLFIPDISSAFSDLTFCAVYQDLHTPGYLEDVIVDEVAVLEWHITSVRSSQATLDFRCKISFHAEAYFEDPNSGMWDSEDHQWLCREHKSGSINGEDCFSCEITITFDKDNPEAINVCSVTFDSPMVIGVDASEIV